MIGIPFWKGVFEDTKEIKITNIKTMTIKEFKDYLKSTRSYYAEIDSKYSFFKVIMDIDLLFAVEDDGIKLSWCRDLKFNYRDKEIFIPYYTYYIEDINLSRREYLALTDVRKDLLDLDIISEEKEDFECYCRVHYDYELRKCILESRDKGITLDYVTLYDKESKQLLRVVIGDLPYTSNTSFSIKDLFNKYKEFMYRCEEVDTDWKKYLPIGKESKYSKEHKLRLELGLKAYSSNYCNAQYNDFRIYKSAEVWGTEFVVIDTPYWQRAFDFEYMVYSIFAQDLPIEEVEYKEDFKKLGVKTRFMSYTEGDVTLVLKHYYKYNARHFRRKTYERYV